MSGTYTEHLPDVKLRLIGGHLEAFSGDMRMEHI
jgi:hypothetical protein